MTFIPALQSVEIIDQLNGTSILFENSDKPAPGLFRRVRKTANGKTEMLSLLVNQDDHVNIAIQVEEKDGTYYIQDINAIPKLFCDFPLIGTENFHFPIVVNSFYFNPQTERDGVWLQAGSDPERYWKTNNCSCRPWNCISN